MRIALNVSKVSIGKIRVSPGNILFSVRLGNSYIGRPLVNITVISFGKVWEDDCEQIADNALDLAPDPTLDLCSIFTANI